jgi:HTH-type transcriptional regulator, sugar sensing transcriptional regulator
MCKLSLERIFKALVNLGLSQTETRVYIHLAIKGQAEARSIIYNLKINKQQLYRCLKRLRNKKIVNSNLAFPAMFSAVPFEKALKILINTKNEQAGIIEEKKAGLLTIWDSINAKDLPS